MERRANRKSGERGCDRPLQNGGARIDRLSGLRSGRRITPGDGIGRLCAGAKLHRIVSCDDTSRQNDALAVSVIDVSVLTWPSRECERHKLVQLSNRDSWGYRMLMYANDESATILSMKICCNLS
ncbi:hypothetical protein GWI33_020378 [Rhynchophorus ferrugineus]|uniref:Uncharacterized protein n=1 Tax=Rhynchophorus ferrugineus TaxID=354439 RepID=A0A834HWN0_RHYFE|nr:hypothetical protein GWI33_020378 [Rhynchophorus ferrugineus]